MRVKAFALSAESPPPSRHSDDLRAIAELGERWVTAVNAGDVGRILTLVADDVVLLPANMPAVRGKVAVELMYRDFFGRFKVEQSGMTEEVRVAGDWAFAWGIDVMRLTPLAGGHAFQVQGRVMSIMRRQAGGEWKFARAISNVSSE